MLCLYPGRAHADLIVNGGFEDPVLNPAEIRLFTPGQLVGSAGWTVLGDSGTNIYVIQTTYAEPWNNISGYNAQEGLNSVDLSGDNNQGPSAGIRQTVSTVQGQQYALSFYVGSATRTDGPGGGFGPATADLSIDGGARISFTNSDSTSGFVNWKQFTYEFTAASNSTTIDFLNGTPIGTSVETGLDNVSLTAVPEPSSLMLAGIGPLALLVSAWRSRISLSRWAEQAAQADLRPSSDLLTARPALAGAA
jgi:hypothetical protein